MYCRSTLQYTTSDTPFLPMRNNLASSVDHQKNHRHFMEKNMSKCSWRCIAIFFVVLAVILSAALAYITGRLTIFNSGLFKLSNFIVLQPPVSFLYPTKVPKLVQWWWKIILNKNPPLPSLLPKKIVLHYSILPPPFPTKIIM